MKIYEMTATFGKLDGDTLTLKSGLNIIEAPNEWGKSTWCAFLIAMLYGIDTRAKSTRGALADKEHYAPWSGQNMSGRIRLTWKKRDITIERTTEGRIPLGKFSAYETETGLKVPELTAENCGEMLLGAERSVFQRTGFVRLSDLPVTRDDALVRRLNALVTTGDESGDGERLARELKNLKNKCRYNRTGLLPQAEEELGKVRNSLTELEKLQEESQKYSENLERENLELQKLQNHLTHLQNQEAREDAERVHEARRKAELLAEKRDQMRDVCSKLPSEEQMQERLQRLQDLMEEKNRLLEEESLRKSPLQILDLTAEKDRKKYEMLQLNVLVVWILAAVCAAAGAALCFALEKIAWAILCLAVAGGLLSYGFLNHIQRKEKLQELIEKYGDPDPDHWTDTLGNSEDHHGKRRLEELKQRQISLCGDRTPGETMEKLRKLLSCRESLRQLETDAAEAQKHLEDLLAMAKVQKKPEDTDELFFSEEETLQKMEEIRENHRKLLSRIGQCQGRMEVLGTENQLRDQEEKLTARISLLEQYYEALAIALSRLEDAAQELQRRFAPQITKRAQELMQKMTDGRYRKLTLDQEFSLKASADGENTMHSAIWRSEGTMDQLYLSLRLAVAEVLTPEAPLILDDALCRFDEVRLNRTLEILGEEEKQVILFTCQDREGKLRPEALIKKN